MCSFSVIVSVCPHILSYRDENGSTFTSIYSLATGAPLVHTIRRRCVDAFGTDVYLLQDTALSRSTSLYGWSPQHTHRTQAMALGDWRFYSNHGALFVFRLGVELLFWIWGSETAVRTTDLAFVATAPSIFSLDYCGGAAFVTHENRSDSTASSTYTLYLVPLLRRESAHKFASLPETLPYEGAPVVSARELYRGRHSAWLSQPTGSPTSAPLFWTSASETDRSLNCLVLT